MFGFFTIPHVISGNSGKLTPPSVMRHAPVPPGLRDRIRSVQGIAKHVTPAAMASSMGLPGIPSSRHQLGSTLKKVLDPRTGVKNIAGTVGSAVRHLKFW